jgi:hypothetical protein
MSKFLKLVEGHTPSIDRNTEIKLMLYKTLTGKGITVENRQLTNFLVITDDEGNKYKVSVDNIENIEDQESFLSKNEKDVLAVTSDLVKDPRRRSFQKDPKKELERSYGDMIKKVAKKVKDVAKKIK